MKTEMSAAILPNRGSKFWLVAFASTLNGFEATHPRMRRTDSRSPSPGELFLAYQPFLFSRFMRF